MSDLLLYVVTGLLVINLIVLIIIMNTRPTGSLIKIEAGLEAMEKISISLTERLWRKCCRIGGACRLNKTIQRNDCLPNVGDIKFKRSQLDIFSQQLTNLTRTNEYRLDKMRHN